LLAKLSNIAPLNSPMLARAGQERERERELGEPRGAVSRKDRYGLCVCLLCGFAGSCELFGYPVVVWVLFRGSD
jgi:hypothetical protein